MKRALQVGGLLLLAGLAPAFCDQKATSVKDAPPPPPAAKKVQGKGALGPKPDLPKKMAPILNPANPATRLFRMTPEQRERALEKFPPKQQENFRKRLAAFDQLPKEMQDIQLRQLEHFERLTPEQQEEKKGLMRELQELPKERVQPVRQVLRRMQTATDAQRENYLKSPMFRERFSPAEQRIIAGLADSWLLN